MARDDVDDPSVKEATIRCQNYSAPEAHPYRVRIDLRDPDPDAGKEGDQDHVPFKTQGDTHGRSRKGRRHPDDYDPERAKRILFIPRTLQDPDSVWRVRDEPQKVVYLCRTGPDEWFMVLLIELGGKNPRFNFNTAYPITNVEFLKKRTRWERLFPKPPSRVGRKPPKGTRW